MRCRWRETENEWRKQGSREGAERKDTRNRTGLTKKETITVCDHSPVARTQ